MTRRGACVVRYDGMRGVVWKIKYRDADGVQVKETLGHEKDGWTQRKARAELEARLTDVRREGLKRTKPVAFEEFAREWFATYPDAKSLKHSTRVGYKLIIDASLVPTFGQLRVATITAGHVEAFIAKRRKAGASPRTINRHLNLLSLILNTALRRGLIRTNPVTLVDRPREPRRKWTILSPEEIRRVEQAVVQLAEEAKGEERAWFEQARVVFLVVFGLGLRRGEVLGLRWRDVLLADPDGARLRVVETWTRNRFDTPKSEASERTLALGQRLAAELFDHRARTAYAGDDELVFCSPAKGTPLDPARYAATLRKALRRAKIEKVLRPFHDGRHSAITNEAAAGNAPAAIQARAGHASFSTTQGYIDLAGVTFREEAERAEARIFGAVAVPQEG